MKKAFQIKGFRFFILFFLMHLCFFPYPACSEDSLQISAEMQLGLAEHFFSQGDYSDAIREYKKFLFFFPDHPRAGEADFRIGTAYFENGEYPKAQHVFYEMISDYRPGDSGDSNTENAEELYLSHRITQAYFMLSRCYMKMNNPPEAFNNLRNLILLSKDGEIWDEAFYRIGWIYMETAMWDKASLYFNKISEQNREKYRVADLQAELSRSAFLARKNPKIAGSLALLPGAGFLYCERYRDAFTAFLLNSAMILAAYKAFDDDNPALGGVIALVGSGFYAGNIYGSVSSAHKYNRDRNRDFMENVKENTRMNLSLIPGAAGIALSLEYSF